MANRHFAEIGDVWKHLPLAEVLALETPGQVWESHAGSARYALEPTPARDYGALRFLRACEGSRALRESRYGRQFAALAAEGDYPGSPLLALSGLPRARFTFCDLDPASLESIRVEASRCGVPDSRVVLREADGVETLAALLRELPAAQAAGVFLLVDPYRPFEPGPAGLSSAELFWRATRAGVRTMLWYGFSSFAVRAELLAALQEGGQRHGMRADDGVVWCAEATPEFLYHGVEDPTGSRIGAGILCGHLAPATRAACDSLGRSLAEAWAGAVLEDDTVASLRFAAQPGVPAPAQAASRGR